ncbi:hypothetical protein OH76DRAFT_1403176 [Lentinus brumalis]|uniref:DUF952-domain-containing protein n=1 Tax=Lentinus brumalis TaxID=2498619 RepID=A0A371DBV2_9APHY|nr:hypothetical protein OH76DRAFT_1403176 [Polyporus brumalis]
MSASKLTTYPLPTYIYKILATPPPAPIPPVLPLSDLDAQDGFIHLSTAAQIPITASLFFASAGELWLLKVDTRKTDGVYRWVEGMPGCPHLYAVAPGTDAAGYVVEAEASTGTGTGARTRTWADLGSANVVGSRAVKRAEGQTWEDAFKGPRDEGWLVDE